MKSSRASLKCALVVLVSLTSVQAGLLGTNLNNLNILPNITNALTNTFKFNITWVTTTTEQPITVTEVTNKVDNVTVAVNTTAAPANIANINSTQLPSINNETARTNVTAEVADQLDSLVTELTQ